MITKKNSYVSLQYLLLKKAVVEGIAWYSSERRQIIALVSASS